MGQADPWVGEPNPDTPLVPEPGLRSRVARGTLVNAAFNVGLSAIGLLKGFIVAGFLTTTEYGVWGFLFISLTQQTYAIPLSVKLRLGWITALELFKQFVLTAGIVVPR